MQIETPIKTVKENPIGFYLALSSALCFSIMGFIVHTQTNGISSHFLAFSRGLTGFIVLIPFVRSEILRLFSWNARYIWLRSIFGALSASCGFWILQQAAATDGRALSYLDPVILLMISLFIFKRKTETREVFGIIIAVLGVILLSLPNSSHLAPLILGISLLGSVFAALSYLFLKQAVRDFSSNLITLSFSIGFMVVSASFLLRQSELTFEMTNEGILAILGVGISGLCGQILLTHSFMHISSAKGSALRLSGFIWTVLLELFFHDHPLSALSWISYAVIVSGVLLLSNVKLITPSSSGSSKAI